MMPGATLVSERSSRGLAIIISARLPENLSSQAESKGLGSRSGRVMCCVPGQNTLRFSTQKVSSELLGERDEMLGKRHRDFVSDRCNRLKGNIRYG